MAQSVAAIKERKGIDMRNIYALFALFVVLIAAACGSSTSVGTKQIPDQAPMQVSPVNNSMFTVLEARCIESVESTIRGGQDPKKRVLNLELIVSSPGQSISDGPLFASVKLLDNELQSMTSYEIGLSNERSSGANQGKETKFTVNGQFPSFEGAVYVEYHLHDGQGNPLSYRLPLGATNRVRILYPRG